MLQEEIVTAPQYEPNPHCEFLFKRHPELASCETSIREAAKAICQSYRSGGKVLICGNGGSASDSEHIVGELMKSFILPRNIPDEDVAKLTAVSTRGVGQLAAGLQRGVPAIALTGHPAIFTAICNDHGAELSFAQQVYVLGRAGDVFLGLSTSGNSANVINAAAVARAFGLVVVGMTGANTSELESLSHVVVKAPAVETYLIQEFHVPIYHTICLMVEECLFGV